eukprot:CAMPEP_0181372502 /NCGR_PEP_ID=MMETSP1106-20121128/14770_1 /TAXON_ID=81844 /ORGANISM="Mantoniella antarctica, Strain SL-175" /LENGTH=184 /DNA_ID=CAMNT_0023489919 /DNA_START=44 /DNA_END=598 /DNA_ORIENTATION=-
MSEEELPGRLAWVAALVQSTYFLPCPNHANAGSVGDKLLTNLFCLSTQSSLCSACASKREPDDVLQVRRSSYHNVVRVQDVSKMMDVSGIQTYVINSARVVFLSERPRPKGKGASAHGGGPVAAKARHSACHHCNRMLQTDMSLYCSIACKLAAGGSMVRPRGQVRVIASRGFRVRAAKTKIEI